MAQYSLDVTVPSDTILKRWMADFEKIPLGKKGFKKMSCYHPLKAFPVGVTENGKTKYKITGMDAECVCSKDGTKWDSYPYVIDIPSSRTVTDYIYIPCGQCVGCRLDYSREWAVRMMAEYEESDGAYFITLTYDDEHLPIAEYVDDYGEIQSIATLYKRDCQLFFKRLRKQKGEGIRYYLAGEYGSTTLRPHYHAIIYNLKLDDLIFYKQTDLGFNLYNSPFLEKTWQKGHVIVGEVSFESCAYVSRYVIGKLKGKLADFYNKFNLTPEFSLMSRKPGIGKSYFDRNFQDIYPDDEMIMDKGGVYRPPRYYDKCMDKIDGEMLQSIKDKRCEIAKTLNDIKLENTSVSYKDLLISQELNVNSRIRKLTRKIK